MSEWRDSIFRGFYWLLDLEAVRPDVDSPVSLTWQAPAPAWLLATLFVGTWLTLLLIYRRESVSRLRKAILFGMRTLALCVVAIALCHPVLRLQRDRVDPAQVALLIDRSSSMNIRDEFAGAGGVSPGTSRDLPSRIEVARAALLADDGGAYRAMTSRNRLAVYSFGGTAAVELPGMSADADGGGVDRFASAVERITCDAPTTNLSRSILDLLRRGASKRLAAIVLLSDGRTTEPGNLSEAVAAARAQQVPVYAVLLGSPEPRRDLFIKEVKHNGFVFLKDRVSVRVTVGARGVRAETEVTVRLIDADTGRELARSVERGATASDADSELFRVVDLHFKPEAAGERRLKVEVVAVPGETETENNTMETSVRVIDENLRVLYVEGYPRYEYRFLKNALLREPTIRSSCLLLSADADFAQEGTDPIRRFPIDMDELMLYDVVLFGDVDPHGDWLSFAQMEMLVEYVGTRGRGFGLLAGTRWAPHAFSGTPLEKLIPVRINRSFSGGEPRLLRQVLHPTLTIEGVESGLFDWGETVGAGEMFEALPGLYWIVRTPGPKPGARVLAELARGGATETLPVFVAGRYGAGRVFFSATDETWRWRRGSDGWMFDTFWLQVCRSLISRDDAGFDNRLVLRSDRSRYRYGQPVQIQAICYDADLAATFGERISVTAVGAEERPVARVELTRSAGDSGSFEGTVVLPRVGTYRLSVEDFVPMPGRRAATVTIQVAYADPEMVRPEADHEALRRLAAETGGGVAEPDKIVELCSAIEDRSIRIPDDVSEPLWDSKLVLALFVLMISMEWVLRKRFGLI